MGRLSPLPVRLFMAFLTVAGAGKGVWRKKSLVVQPGLAREIGTTLAKRVVIPLPDPAAVVGIIVGSGGDEHEQPSSHKQEHGGDKYNTTALRALCPEVKHC